MRTQQCHCQLEITAQVQKKLLYFLALIDIGCIPIVLACLDFIGFNCAQSQMIKLNTALICKPPVVALLTYQEA